MAATKLRTTVDRP